MGLPLSFYSRVLTFLSASSLDLMVLISHIGADDKNNNFILRVFPAKNETHLNIGTKFPQQLYMNSVCDAGQQWEI